jgi:6-phosphogluconolactonase
MSEYKVTIKWQRTSPDFLKGKYSREHTWTFDGGVTVPASPSPSVVPVPYSNPANVDPEEAFVAAISSCHMLTFLFLASTQGFQIDSYEDEAVGVMTKNEKGVPWVSSVTLNPKIIYSGNKLPAPADEKHLHRLAHEQCFIANSIKTEVVVHSQWKDFVPVKKFELISFANADELASRAAGAWLDEIEMANRAEKTHCVALSGGRIAQKFFAATVAQARARAVAFECVHFFWADERCVPPTDPDSNFKMANELLFAPLKISAEKIHRIRGENSPQAAVKIAEEELCRFAPSDKNSRPALDLIFLGMGEDGHVASLFPGATRQILDTVPFVAIEHSPKPPPRRISLSYAAILAANSAWVLVSGDGKEQALQESLNPKGQTPLARVIQSRSHTKVFSDLRHF